MIRLIILITIIIFHKDIYNFLVSKNLNTLTGIQKNIFKKNKKFKNFIQGGDLDNVLAIIKKIDKNIYKECKIILKSINNIRQNIEKNLAKNKHYRTNFYHREYDNIKFERKKILNIITSMIVSYGFLDEHSNFVKVIDKYIKSILNEITNIITHQNRAKTVIDNIEHFREDINSVEPNDTNINVYYDIF
jgi:hypothetical protein